VPIISACACGSANYSSGICCSGPPIMHYDPPQTTCPPPPECAVGAQDCIGNQQAGPSGCFFSGPNSLETCCPPGNWFCNGLCQPGNCSGNPPGLTGIKSITATDTNVEEALTKVSVLFYDATNYSVEIDVNKYGTSTSAGNGYCAPGASGNSCLNIAIDLSLPTDQPEGTYTATAKIDPCPEGAVCSKSAQFTVKYNQQAVAIPETNVFLVIIVAMAVVFIIARKSEKRKMS